MVDSSRRSLILLGLVVAVCVCGGIAGDATAEFQRAIRRGSGACPAGWAIDPLRAACGRCPGGYTRTVLPLDAMACERPATVLHARATRRGRGTGAIGTDCPAGQFFYLLDLKGYCYSCPAGYASTGRGIGGGDACAKPVPPSFSAAQWRPACPSGSFRDLGRGDCWSCPSNWARTAAPVDGPTACTSDVAGMLGVDPRAMCVDALRAIEAGGAVAAQTQSAIDALMGPIVKPVNDSLNAVTRRFRTPAEFERLFTQLAAPLRAHPEFLDELPDLADRVMKAQDRLGRLLLDPAVVCDGDLVRAGRELNTLDLWPRAWRNQSLGARTTQPYLVVAVEVGFTSAFSFGTVGSLSLVVDGRGPVALLGSLGGSLGLPQAAAAGLGLNVLYFPSAEPADFLAVNSLGIQFNADLIALYQTLTAAAGRPDPPAAERQRRFGAELDFVVSFDPTLQSAGFPAGFGYGGTFKGKLRRPGTTKSTGRDSDLSSVTSNAEWSRAAEPLQRALAILKTLTVSGDHTWRVLSLRPQ